MTTLEFTVHFHGPFSIATGAAADGLDHVVDPTTPFPSSEVKGLLRAHAKHWLGLPDQLTDEIFGNARDRGGWIFSDVEVEPVKRAEGTPADANPEIWNRVSVDGQGRARERALVSGEQVWARPSAFTASWDQPGDPPAEHGLAIRAAARDVVSVGMNRRRGFGWVTITDSQEWTEQNSIDLLELRGQR